jgi:hypothetical protein
MLTLERVAGDVGAPLWVRGHSSALYARPLHLATHSLAQGKCACVFGTSWEHAPFLCQPILPPPPPPTSSVCAPMSLLVIVAAYPIDAGRPYSRWSGADVGASG